MGERRDGSPAELREAGARPERRGPGRLAQRASTSLPSQRVRALRCIIESSTGVGLPLATLPDSFRALTRRAFLQAQVPIGSTCCPQGPCFFDDDADCKTRGWGWMKGRMGDEGGMHRSGGTDTARLWRLLKSKRKHRASSRTATAKASPSCPPLLTARHLKPRHRLANQPRSRNRNPDRTAED